MSNSPKNQDDKTLRIVWLGDDFTGAAAVMEVLTFSGIPSLLFLDIPTEEQLAACAGIEAFGIATLARSHSPEWMETHLPVLFAFLKDTRSDLVHYKICSTLDSSAHTGSIGKAIELALEHFGEATVPVVTGAPELGRYQVYGNLFCSAGDAVYRLDRHPVMSRHPVTPMHEADVARHLAKQTDIPTRCLDLELLADPAASIAFLNQTAAANICTFDCIDSEHLKRIGKLLWERRGSTRFLVGSQGVEYALVAHFAETGRLPAQMSVGSLGPNPRTGVVSGSVSPTTASQIDWARDNGFAAIRVDAVKLCASEQDRTAEELTALKASKQALSEGLCPLIFTAQGPDDPEVKRFRATIADQNAANIVIGKSLGRILFKLIGEADLGRVAVSGGDTSGHVCSELGIYALEAAAPTIPGAAICRARSETALDGLEIALKGGQMGSQDYFGWIRDGGGARL